ncbi:hypothetical protein HFO51_06635 [Rhizobium leguminosarum]|uniref:hypothetical protein n=1 Tax=Rhizobium leguminosarum TaxID=384 RepID=UPI001C97C19F|nr:hypothetical protein [Rhizobium leguminosarum]MBY5594145.1 hypothetical protein [Rhizobium leguminosarum]
MALGTPLPDCHTREDVLKWLMCHRQWNAALARMEAIGFKAGQEAMRERAAEAATNFPAQWRYKGIRQRFDIRQMEQQRIYTGVGAAEDIRALPIEEPK